MGFWCQWALNIHRYGISNAYNTSMNYFPVFLYGLYFYDWLQGTEANIIANINSIKILFVFFDFLPLIVLCCFRQRILNYKIPYLFLLINIAYVFNSMVWGQIDSIYTNLAFLAIITALLYPIAGVLLYLLALNTKAQAIEFLPIMGLILFYSFKKVKTFVLAVLCALILQALILLPFLTNGGVAKFWYHAVHSVDLYNNLSIGAFNIWYLITSGNPYFINDKDTYLLLSYKSVGLILFSLSVIYVLYPLAKKMWYSKKQNLMPDDALYHLVFLSTGLLCLYFFYFNSQMHERYVHPIIIFFFFFGVVSKNYKLYFLASIPYILSLDKCYSFPEGYLPVVHYKIIFASKVIAIWKQQNILGI